MNILALLDAWRFLGPGVFARNYFLNGCISLAYHLHRMTLLVDHLLQFYNTNLAQGLVTEYKITFPCMQLLNTARQSPLKYLCVFCSKKLIISYFFI